MHTRWRSRYQSVEGSSSRINNAHTREAVHGLRPETHAGPRTHTLPAPKLPTVVASPCHDPTIVHYCHAVCAASGNLDGPRPHAPRISCLACFRRCGPKTSDAHGHVGATHRAVSQLTGNITSPRPQAPITAHCHRMCTPRCYTHDILSLKPVHNLGNLVVHCPPNRPQRLAPTPAITREVAAFMAIPKGKDGRVAQQNQDVPLSCTDLCHMHTFNILTGIRDGLRRRDPLSCPLLTSSSSQQPIGQG